jgi:hypothetical protein
MAGSAKAPMPSEHIVIPSWAPASITDSSFEALIPARARPSPSAASCSNRDRRAASTANSAATNAPLAASSNSESPRAIGVLIARCPRHLGRTVGCGSTRRPGGPSTRPRVRGPCRRPRTRRRPRRPRGRSPAGSSPARRRCRRALRAAARPNSRGSRRRPMRRAANAPAVIDDRRPAPAHPPGSVVLILDRSEQALDQILQGDDAGQVAVLVGDDSQLAGPADGTARGPPCAEVDSTTSVGYAVIRSTTRARRPLLRASPRSSCFKLTSPRTSSMPSSLR